MTLKAMDTMRHTCLKLHDMKESEPIFIKGKWYPNHFHLSITDGLQAWICHASEEEVNERAAQWDQPVLEYIELAERYLGFQQPGSVYGFNDAGDGQKRLSWTFEKEGTKLQWRWKCQQSPNPKKITAEILDFLMDSNIKLSEEVVSKTQSFEKLKVEAEMCLEQSEKIAAEKVEFESEIYAKFLQVLNSKKVKLRELRDQLAKQKTDERFPEEEDTEKTESFDDQSDSDKGDEGMEDLIGTSKDVQAVKPSARKRKAHKRLETVLLNKAMLLLMGNIIEYLCTSHYLQVKWKLLVLYFN